MCVWEGRMVCLYVTSLSSRSAGEACFNAYPPLATARRSSGLEFLRRLDACRMACQSCATAAPTTSLSCRSLTLQRLRRIPCRRRRTQQKQEQKQRHVFRQT